MSIPILNCANTTVFTSALFARIWAEVYGRSWQSVGAKNDLGIVFSQSAKLPLRRYELSPLGLYWGNTESASTHQVQAVNLVEQLIKQWNSISLSWNIRHDQQNNLFTLSRRLAQKDYVVDTLTTHVIDLRNQNYESLLSGTVKSMTRRHLRYGMAADLEIRSLTHEDDMMQHDDIYDNWARRKGIRPLPKRLIHSLVTRLEAAELLGAFKDKLLLAAILLFKDSSEWFYWHGVRESERDNCFSMDMLFGHAIQSAIQNDVSYFNLGGSNNVVSLENFKERWGARKVPVWRLTWSSPFWKTLLKGRNVMRRSS